MTRRRCLLAVALASFTTIAIACVFLVPALVRSRMHHLAQRYSAVIHIQSVRPTWRGIVLRSVEVSLSEVPAVVIRLESVSVGINRKIDVHSPNVVIQGEWAAVMEQLAAWQKRLSSNKRPGNAGGRMWTVAVHSGGFHWPGWRGTNSGFRIADIQIENVLGPGHARATVVEIATPAASVRAANVDAEVASGLRALKMIRIDQVSARLGGVGRSETGPPSGKASEASQPILAKVRDVLGKVALSQADMMPSGARAIVDAFDLRIEHGDDALTLGPAVLSITEDKGHCLIDLRPLPGVKGGLTLRASIPAGSANRTMDVSGGPVSLRALGVQEGQFGLKETDRAQVVVQGHIEIPAQEGLARFDGSVQLTSLAIQSARLAEDLIGGMSLGARLKGAAALDGTFVEFEDAAVELGAAEAQVRGSWRRNSEGMSAEGSFVVPLTSCQRVLDAIPRNLISVASDIGVAGTLSLKGRARYDAARPSDFLLDYASTFDCRVTRVPETVDVRRFQSVFELMVYDEDGNRTELETGPGTASWTSMGNITHFMQAAVFTTEDGRFLRHHGFDHEAIRRSMHENLKAGRFVRGASTISMQLAKNLYLTRTKTLARKLQELILTSYIEQALTKEQILELYFNVVEFGPMTYGVGPAAEKYFHTLPSNLSLSQAMYLASLLPNPKRNHAGQDGRVNASHMNYLRRLMIIAAKRHLISRDELLRGLREVVVLGAAEPERLEAPPEELKGEFGDDGWEPKLED